MTNGAQPHEERPVRQDARASGNARVYQSAGNQYVETHLYFGQGVQRTRRVEADAVSEVSPYPTDMAAFGPEDAEWFFGRDRVLAELVAQLDRRLRHGGGPLIVVAPSGAGKSSLLQAGLIPKLEQGALPGSQDWPGLRLTPTGHPLMALASAISGLTGAPAQQIAQQLWADPAGTVENLRVLNEHRVSGSRARVVVLVDQLEELFTLCEDEQERHRFLNVISRLTDRGPAGQDPLALVVYGLRADFYAQCANYPQLRDALQYGPVVLGPMSPKELQEAILYPAQRAGLRVEPGLVDVLLRDLGATTSGGIGDEDARGYEAGRLPLLAHALRATWRERHGQTLTVDGYRLTGGIQHAVATTAERTFAMLTPEQQEAARTLFLRLVKIGDGTEDTRQLVLRAELLGDDAGRRVILGAVLDAFTQDRLLTQGQHHVEITHEALLRAWPRLREWINEDRSGNLIRQQLHDAAVVWDRDGRDSGALYRGSRLQTARDWRSAQPQRADLLPMDSAFLDASIRFQYRAVRRRRVGVATLSFLTVLSLIASLVAVRQVKVSNVARDTAIFNQINAQADRLNAEAGAGTDMSLAAQLKLTAYENQPSGSTAQADLYTNLISTENLPLATPVRGHNGSVWWLAYSPDGQTLATGNVDGTVQLWDVSGRAHPVPLGKPLTGHTDIVYSVAFSPDGKLLATGSNDATIRLWDVSDRAHPVLLPNPPTDNVDAVYSLAFSPNGQFLAGGGLDTVIRLWDVRDPKSPKALPSLTGDTDAVESVAFSPDGQTLASGSADGTVRLWDVGDPADHVSLRSTLTEESIAAVAFSPNGRTLAGALGDGDVQLWTVTDPAHPQPLGKPLAGHTGAASSLAFSPNGGILATGGVDDTVQLWNVGDPAAPTRWGRTLTGATSTVISLAFGPDGLNLAVGSQEDTVRLWDIPAASLAGTGGAFGAVQLSPDRTTLAGGANDGTVWLWDVHDPARPKPLGPPLTGPTAGVEAVTFSPDGSTLAGASDDGTVWLWDVHDPARPKPLGPPLNGSPDGAASVVFSPDGRTLVSGSQRSGVWLWNVADKTHPLSLSPPLTGDNGFVHAAFTPDGTILVTVGTEGQMRLRNIADPAHPVLLGGPVIASQQAVLSVAVSPDGKLLATAADDTTVRLWSLADPSHPVPIGAPLAGHTNTVWWVTFSPNGKALASASADGTVRLWDVADLAHPTAVGQPITIGGASIGSVSYGPGGGILATGGADGTVRLWDLSLERAVSRICSTTQDLLTPDAWTRYVSEELPFAPPCRER